MAAERLGTVAVGDRVVAWTDYSGRSRRTYISAKELRAASGRAGDTAIPVLEGHDGAQLGTASGLRMSGNKLIASLLFDVAPRSDGFSLGFTADYITQPGEHDGERFAEVAKNVRINHIALTDAPAIGEARLHADGARVTRVERADYAEASAEASTGGKVFRAARVSRVGVQDYYDASGLRRELRLPSEVFHPDALASIDEIPLVIGHNGDRTPRGVVRRPRARGHHVEADVHVPAQHADAIDAAPRGLSMEYVCRLDAPDPKLVAEWGPHDAIQRSIRCTALAAVDTPRCGPSCSLKADCATCAAQPITEGATNMAKKNDVSFLDLDLEAENMRLTKALADMTGERDNLLAQLQVLHLASRSGKADAAAVATEARRLAALYAEVQEHGISSHVALDGMTEIAIKKLVVESAQPRLNLDGMSDAFVDGAYEAVRAARKAGPTAIHMVRTVGHADFIDGYQAPLRGKAAMERNNAAMYFRHPDHQRADGDDSGLSPREKMERRYAAAYAVGSKNRAAK